MQEVHTQWTIYGKKNKRMIQKIKKLTAYIILRDSIKDFISGESMGLAAGTAFYTIFSLPAFAIIILNIGTAIFSESEMQAEILHQIEVLAGAESKASIEEIFNNFEIGDSKGIPNFVAVMILAFSATTVFVSLQNAINHIWHIKPKPEKGLLKFAINRLLSFSLIASIGLILVVSLILDAIFVIINNYLAQFLIVDIPFDLAAMAHFFTAQAFFVLIFALMYKILPDAKVRWRDTWLGAFITMVLIGIGKYLIGIYMGNSDLGSTYGAAGSLVILLVWTYYSIVIFLFGAQITYYIAENVGGSIIPKDEAVRVELREIE